MNGISYGYDADTRELFSEEELKLSDTDYSGKEKDAISLCANRLSLTGNIGVQYYIEMPEEVQQDPGTFVCFEVDGREQKKAASSGEKMTLTYFCPSKKALTYKGGSNGRQMNPPSTLLFHHFSSSDSLL